MCGRQAAEKFGLFHIQFDEVLQEKLLLKTEKRVGPELEEDSEEEQAAKQELEELAMQANVTVEEEKAKKQVMALGPRQVAGPTGVSGEGPTEVT